jgi:hypothetical protein
MDTLEKISLAQRICSEVLPRSVREPGVAVLHIGATQNALGIGGESRALHEILEDTEFEFFSSTKYIGRVGPAGCSNTCYFFKLPG